MQLNTVVFPAPLGPISPKISPFFTSKDKFSTAWTPPKYIHRFCTLSTVSSGILRPVFETAPSAFFNEASSFFILASSSADIFSFFACASRHLDRRKSSTLPKSAFSSSGGISTCSFSCSFRAASRCAVNFSLSLACFSASSLSLLS